MGFMLLKKISLVFLLVSVSFLSTSLAGRRSKLGSKSIKEAGAAHKEISRKALHHYHKKPETIHERLLRMNTKDYGSYNPSPSLEKPPFKLIPN